MSAQIMDHDPEEELIHPEENFEQELDIYLFENQTSEPIVAP